MSIRKIDKIVKLGKHPLEEHFDIDPGTTEIVTTARHTELESYEPYDSKDKELEQDYQMIMDNAMDMVDRLKEYIDGGAEAKFLARLAEVTGQQLGLALSAAEKKAKLKDNKDKFIHRKNTAPGSKTINHNNMTLIMDRNQMLEALMQQKPEDDIIDVEHKQID